MQLVNSSTTEPFISRGFTVVIIAIAIFNIQYIRLLNYGIREIYDSLKINFVSNKR